jgi:hypothetical protein
LSHSLKLRAFNVARVAAYARQSFQVFITLREGVRTLPGPSYKYYSDLWEVLERDSYKSAIINCAMLDDDASKDYKLSTILKESSKLALPASGIIPRLQNEIENIKPIARKIRILRNHVHAHRSRSLTYREARDEANLSFKELNFITETYRRVSDAVSVEVFGWNSWTVGNQAQLHTERLLASLAGMAAEGSSDEPLKPDP